LNMFIADSFIGVVGIADDPSAHRRNHRHRVDRPAVSRRDVDAPDTGRQARRLSRRPAHRYALSQCSSVILGSSRRAM